MMEQKLNVQKGITKSLTLGTEVLERERRKRNADEIKRETERADDKIVYCNCPKHPLAGSKGFFS